MTIRDLEHLYDYHYWANGKLFEVVARLTPGAFAQEVAGSYGSVRNTLVHILSAERIWLARSGAPVGSTPLDPADFPTPESLVDVWAEVELQVRGFLSTLRDEDLVHPADFVMRGTHRLSIPVGELLQNAVLHAVHHRGQVALLLRMLGHVPGNFDMVLYAAGQRGVWPG